MAKSKPLDPALCHAIRETNAGFEIVTHYGYVLKTCATRDDAENYLAYHCPVR